MSIKIDRMFPDFIANIQKALGNPLPGLAAQLKMANAFRVTKPPTSKEARIASVLLLFYQKNGEWYFPLIQRTSNHPNDKHSGQISFPGGKKEAEDIDLAMTARREAEEEIGVQQTDIQLVGELTSLYIPVSNFMVYPFIGYLPYVPNFTRQASEVVEILEIALKDFQDLSNRKRKTIAIRED